MTVCGFTVQVSPEVTIWCFVDRRDQEVNFLRGGFHGEFNSFMAFVQIIKELIQFFLTMGPNHHQIVKKSLVKYRLFIITVDKLFLKISHKHICQTWRNFCAHGSTTYL